MPYRGRAEEDKKCKAEWLLALGDTRNAIGTNNIVQAESSRITFSPSLERPESGEILRTVHIQAPTSQYAPGPWTRIFLATHCSSGRPHAGVLIKKRGFLLSASTSMGRCPAKAEVLGRGYKNQLVSACSWLSWVPPRTHVRRTHAFPLSRIQVVGSGTEVGSPGSATRLEADAKTKSPVFCILKWARLSSQPLQPAGFLSFTSVSSPSLAVSFLCFPSLR